MGWVLGTIALLLLASSLIGMAAVAFRIAGSYQTD